MKITYREAFATQLQKNLQAVSAILVEVPEGKDGTPPLSFVEGIIVSVEKATNKKITAKSPNWIFDRLWARLGEWPVEPGPHLRRGHAPRCRPEVQGGGISDYSRHLR